MHKQTDKNQNTPYLSGGYLNWVVERNRNNQLKTDIHRILAMRPRERKINRLH